MSHRPFYRRLLSDAIKNYRVRDYHNTHKREAVAILRSLKLAAVIPSDKDRNEANAYAREVLGWKGFAPWLHVYSALAGKFREGWIPDNYYGAVVLPALKGEYGRIEGLKPLARRLFLSDSFPDVAFLVHGRLYDRSYQPIEKSRWSHVLFEQSDRIVFKPDYSRQGLGILVFNEATFDPGRINSLGNGVFQRFICQHETLCRLSCDATATLRITTASLPSGDISVRASHLRLGRRGETHVAAKTQLRVAVDFLNGQIHKVALDDKWHRIWKHPDTGAVFEGMRVPHYDKCLSTVIALHKTMPFATCVGWDLAIGADEGVYLLEWNGDHNGITFSEAMQGPCFAGLGWENLWKSTSKTHGA